MAIKQPRRFVTTDQGHADVFNQPIDTLYENDQALAAQIENIKNDPAGNDIASKAALDNHIFDTNLHVTAAKQATWNAAEGNAKKYTEQYAAPKAHTHPASDLPSASTQARGIVQINTSVSSTSTDQAAAPIAVKTAYDRANEAYSMAQQAFQSGNDYKQRLVAEIIANGGSATMSEDFDSLISKIAQSAQMKYKVKGIERGTSGGDLFTVPSGFNSLASGSLLAYGPGIGYAFYMSTTKDATVSFYLLDGSGRRFDFPVFRETYTNGNTYYCTGFKVDKSAGNASVIFYTGSSQQGMLARQSRPIFPQILT
ncbi:phage tail protein [Paenibacillus sp. BJ-4]|uniref:phage tail protein n=1 Tax=Paenibacillus sp. BJ-4 TaxID=2878097 RepID=UPI001CF0D092|nr:phage tail protein [Paenibacillus sp. BJ-4]